MADDIATVCGDKDNAATLVSPASPFCVVKFECKSEPCTSLTNFDEDLSAFDESAALHLPVSIPTIKHPIVLLERCDKIWKTLQLIKTVQIEKPTILTDDCDDCNENKEETAESLDKVKRSLLYTRYQTRKHDTVPLPFKFSIQRTKKLYPCTTCGKQYLERRSLRKHSERVHGVVLPLLKIHKRWKRIALKEKSEATSAAGNESNSLETLYDNKDSYGKTTAKTKPINTIITSPAKILVKCTLCQQKVLSLRKHLIRYHKIGSSSSVVKQLESSLLSETTTSENKKTTVTDESHQDGDRIMDNENNTCKSQVKRKTTLSYGNTKKKLKLNNKYNAQKSPVVTKKQMLIPGSLKCDVCLGLYATMHSFYKHRRIHTVRGETKENFHKVQCRYFNSPFNKNYKLLVEAKSSANTKNTSDTSFNQSSKISRATRYNERMKRNNEITCICGRSFRNPHTLFIHKKHCELCQSGSTITRSTRVSSDKDSGIGINITIKKRNDSYEIVGKDDESEKSETSNLQEDTLSISHTITKASTKQQILDTSESSKYSKDHSILKLQDTDEDVIIDIEDDVQISLSKDDVTNKMIKQNDDKQELKLQNDNAKDEEIDEVVNKVTTLKQMCQEVLDGLKMHKFENTENKNEEYTQIKDEEPNKEKENSQVKNQEIHQENKRRLRSKRQQYFRVELDHSYDGTKVNTMLFDPLICGYCKKEFNTIKLYDSHQCTVLHGRSFDAFSLQLLCFCCKKVLNNYNEFDEHVRTKHFEHVYHCYYCPERFKSDKERVYHFNKVHNDLVCRFCNKRISLSAKAFHEAYHLGFGYPCHKCQKAYISNKNLSYHKQTVHSIWADNLMTCTICLKCVKIKTFRKHMSTHKINACHFCGKMFSDRVGIEYHTMMHHGTNTKLKCNVCGTRFHTKKQLEMHEKIDGCKKNKHKMKKKTAVEHAKDC